MDQILQMLLNWNQLSLALYVSKMWAAWGGGRGDGAGWRGSMVGKGDKGNTFNDKEL